MSARTLAYKMMVLTPAIFLASLAVQSRTYSDPFVPLGQTAANQEAISAYIEPMKQAKALLNVTQAEQTPEALRNVTDRWIDGGKKGILKPLYPEALFDRTSEGVKGQIFLANAIMTERLMILAQRELKEGDAGLAAEDTVRAIRLAGVLKFSSFESVYNGARTQKKALQQLEDMLPKLTPSQLGAVRQELADVHREQKPLTLLAGQAKRLYMDDQRRKGEEPSIVVATEQFNSMRRLIDKHTPASEWRIKLASSQLVTTESYGPDVMTMARIAYVTQAGFTSELDEAMKALTKTAKD